MPICILKDIESSKIELDDVTSEAKQERNFLAVSIKGQNEEFIYYSGSGLLKDQKKINKYFNNNIEPE